MFLFLTTTLSLLEPHLETYAEKEVSLLGFLVCDEKEEWYLARQPRIRSCCKGEGEVRLPASFPLKLKNQMVRMKGIFHASAGGYVLENPLIE